MKRVAGVALLLVGVASALLGACASDDDPPASSAPDPTVAEATTSTAAAAAIDVTKVPETITVEYLDAVMDEIDHLLGEAIRTLVAEGGPTKNFQQKLDAVYDEPQLSDSHEAIGGLATQEPTPFRDSPDDPATSIQRILSARSDCVFAEARRSLGPLLKVEPSAELQRVYLVLRPKGEGSDPGSLNPTYWAVTLDANSASDSAPRDPCRA